MTTNMSERTKTRINDERYVTDENDDFYPSATSLGRSSPYSGTIRRINPDDIPTTTADMSRMFRWEYGDKVYGSHAKQNTWGKEYRRDINAYYGKEDEYLDKYIDTLFGEKLVSERFEDGDQ